MTTAQIDLTQKFNCSAEFLFSAWLYSKKHGKIIGSNAYIQPEVNSKFSMWSRTIQGKNVKIDKKNPIIIQQCRSEYGDWTLNNPSTVTIKFEPLKDGTSLVRLTQYRIPENHVSNIQEGWNDYYWEPVRAYLEKV